MGKLSWRAVVPIATAGILALLSPPAGLPQHAWYFFAIFAGVIVGIMCEPIPAAAIGLIGLTLVTVLARHVLYGPAELAKAGFTPATAALAWALTGFSNGTVWLIFSAFVFALGYEKTGLGRRIALRLLRALGGKTLTLGYAVACSDAVLAPFTPSNTARGGGIIFPIIRNLPGLYDSKPNDPSARKIGSYLMWVGIASCCVTSSMFLTGQASNLLGVDFARTISHVEITWLQWLVTFGPAGLVLFLATPWLAYTLYPPEIKQSQEVPAWAAQQLVAMGGLTRREGTLAALVILALGLWMFGGAFINATTAALVVIVLMLLTRVLTWDDILGDKPAWNTFAWFATLVTLADGLNRVGFIKWFATSVVGQMTGVTPTTATILLVLVYFCVHYMFATITAQVTAMVPVMLAVAATIPGIAIHQFALTLMLVNGFMGIITPYGTGPAPVFYGSGYLPSSDYWKYGALFGGIYLATYLLIVLPWMHFLG